MKRQITAILFTLVLAAAVFAHGDKKHVIGVIEKLTNNSITVKTREGKSVEVKLAPTTAYLLRAETSDKPATFADLAVGENVVIHATPKGNDLEAEQVRFSVLAPAPAADSKSQK
jgi:hypothetical protein